MSAKSTVRGHAVTYDRRCGRWVYDDTGNAVSEEPIRPCVRCGRVFEGSYIGEADPCLGELPGVDNACCGHGDPTRAYIRFTNGVTVKGFTGIEYTPIHKDNHTGTVQTLEDAMTNSADTAKAPNPQPTGGRAVTEEEAE